MHMWREAEDVYQGIKLCRQGRNSAQSSCLTTKYDLNRRRGWSSGLCWKRAACHPQAPDGALHAECRGSRATGTSWGRTWAKHERICVCVNTVGEGVYVALGSYHVGDPGRAEGCCRSSWAAATLAQTHTVAVNDLHVPKRIGR